MDNTKGIGIAEFYRGKNILVIGGTGFLAKGDKIGCFSTFVLLFFIPINSFSLISSYREDFEDES